MKTNKTKPIKKIMIFTIITVMIVSLFAVPAFAAITVTWREVDASYTPEPITMDSFINYPDRGSVSTAGMYALTFDNLYNDISEGQYMSLIDIFPNFSGVGYLEVRYTTEVQYYIFGTGLRTDGDDIEVKVGYDADFETYCVYFNSRTGGFTAYTIANAVCTFYLTAYPPVAISGGSSTTYFWNDHATYRVGVVSSGSTDPDPEDPDTPTDPEDPDTPTPPADGEEQGIFAVWSKITQWIVQGLASVSNAFYADGKLTLLGTLCIIPLALGLAFLLIGIIQKFLRLRG